MKYSIYTRNNLRLTTIILATNLICINLLAQYTQPGKPTGTFFKNHQVILLDTFKEIDNKQDTVKKMFKNYLPVKAVALNLSPKNSGTWFEHDNHNIWRLHLTYPDASKMSVCFSDYNIVPDVKIFIYNKEKTDILGALSSLNNKGSGLLPTRFIRGNELCIELQVPITKKNYGDFVISKVLVQQNEYEFKSLEREPCSNDITCYDNPLIPKIKDGVCQIRTHNDINCTGVLINTTLQDASPYVLTANHCITDQEDADNSIFTFNLEHFDCDCPDSKYSKSIAGGTLVATNKKYDFSLVKLSLPLDSSYNPEYIGWDITGNSFSNVICIHHMDGLEKSLSYEFDKIEKVTFHDVVDYFAKNAHWKISEWDIGTTLGGSSGAPLFSSEGAVIGLLSGGEANCFLPVNDYFADISLAWDSDPDSSKQLKHWLDPLKSGNTYQEPYRPFAPVEDNPHLCNLNGIANKTIYESGIIVCPTLVKDNLIIRYNNEIPLKTGIEIYNATGQLIWQTTRYLHTGENILNLGDLRSGICFVKLIEINLTRKIIIKH